MIVRTGWWDLTRKRSTKIDSVALARAMLREAGVRVDQTSVETKCESVNVPNDFRRDDVTETRHGTPPNAFVHTDLVHGSNDAAGPDPLRVEHVTTFDGAQAKLRLWWLEDMIDGRMILDVHVEGGDAATADAMLARCTSDLGLCS